jgi:hypothetical protein
VNRLVNTIQTCTPQHASHVQLALIVEPRLCRHQLVFATLVITARAPQKSKLLIQLQKVVESVVLDTIVLKVQVSADFVHQVKPVQILL